MNQNEFFNILMDGLKDLPESKLRDIVSYYDNKFTHGETLGQTEEEIITELGNPNLIVNQYKIEFLDIDDISIPLDAAIKNTDSNNDKNTDNIDTDNIINAISDNYFNSTNSINSSKIETNDEILSTANITVSNNTNPGHNNFTIDDTLNNPESILMTHNNLDSNLDNAPYSKPCENISSSNNFYNLYTNNQPVEGDKSNYDNNTSDSQNCNYNATNSSSKNSQSRVNLILKISIVVVTLLIFSPVITGIIGCIIGLFGVAISVLVGSIGLLIGGTFTSLVGVPNVPMFVANFPYPVIVLFSLGSISLSLFLTLVFYYLCKFFVRLLIKAYRALKLKGGDL